jgi:hypothetical protein
MKKKSLLKIAASVACVVAASVVSANADLTMTLDDGLGHVKTLNDGGSGQIVFIGGLDGSVWSMNIDIAVTKPLLGSALDPQLDVDIQMVNSTAAGTLTLTAISTGFGPLGNDAGQAVLAAGGASGGVGKSVTVFGLVNGGQVASIGPVTTTSWSGTASGNVSGLSSTFSIGEKIVITHTGAADGPKGDFDISVAVPEPSTCLAGVLLLLPFGASALRLMRKKQAA